MFRRKNYIDDYRRKKKQELIRNSARTKGRYRFPGSSGAVLTERIVNLDRAFQRPSQGTITRVADADDCVHKRRQSCWDLSSQGKNVERYLPKLIKDLGSALSRNLNAASRVGAVFL